ncbi:MAG: ABC transporter substrate-binding protein, partial [Alphaproteobacteria bacterium]
MRVTRMLKGLALGVAALGLTASPAIAQDKTIKVGVIYDYSGPLAGGGSELHGFGTKMIIDYMNAQGGVEGYKIDAIYADAQSKPDVAIN